MAYARKAAVGVLSGLGLVECVTGGGLTSYRYDGSRKTLVVTVADDWYRVYVTGMRNPKKFTSSEAVMRKYLRQVIASL